MSTSVGVYMNWFRLDPLFTIRMLFHAWHPNSPLSHPALTRRVFFSDALPEPYVEEFQRRTAPYESMLWVMGMRKLFVSPPSILSQISGWTSTAGQRLLVLAGEGDKIMTPPEMQKLAKFYRDTFKTPAVQKKLGPVDADLEVQSAPGEGGQDTAGQGVQLRFVPGAGHHMQNDVGWEVGARKLLEFYEQLD